MRLDFHHLPPPNDSQRLKELQVPSDLGELILPRLCTLPVPQDEMIAIAVAKSMMLTPHAGKDQAVIDTLLTHLRETIAERNHFLNRADPVQSSLMPVACILPTEIVEQMGYDKGPDTEDDTVTLSLLSPRGVTRNTKGDFLYMAIANLRNRDGESLALNADLTGFAYDRAVPDGWEPPVALQVVWATLSPSERDGYSSKQVINPSIQPMLSLSALRAELQHILSSRLTDPEFSWSVPTTWYSIVAGIAASVVAKNPDETVDMVRSLCKVSGVFLNRVEAEGIAEAPGVPPRSVRCDLDIVSNYGPFRATVLWRTDGTTLPFLTHITVRSLE
ncbi:MAG: hypothetical protein EBZ48_02550 [Proteobacteria bacterium]|nr:hypothetical protein [Pseudomonadota bacterium]